MERRLTAIFALDMVGYSRLMETDELDTLRRLESVRAELIDPAIDRHRGRVVKSTGDGLLAEFASAVDAVECAAEIQGRMARRELDIPLERRVRFRIGINVGDVVARDGDIFGDGVNVAARIESLADPDGVLISRSVYDQVQNKVGLAFVEAGSRSIKNLERPVHLYRVLQAPGEQRPVPRRPRGIPHLAVSLVLAIAALVAAWQMGPGFSRANVEPSIAVLPFTDLSPEGDQEYFAEGISEELLNLLGQIPDLRVSARTSSFAFKDENLGIPEIGERLHVNHVLEGSVRKDGKEVRVTAQLIRAADGFHVWSHTWDRRLDDIFEIQDEIAADVVEHMRVSLGVSPSIELTDPEAYALYLQARQVSRQRTPEAFDRAVRLYREALAIDPEYATAWAGLAGTYAFQTGAHLLPFDEGYGLARDAAERALSINDDNAEAHAYLGYVALHERGDLQSAARHYEHAVELEPTNPDILWLAARLARNLGRRDEPVRIMEYVVARDPVNPANHAGLGSIYWRAGRLDEAISAFQDALDLSPGHAGSQFAIGVVQLMKGDLEASLEAIRREPAEWYRLTGLVMAYHALGRRADSDEALAELIEKYEEGWAYQIAYALAYRGDVDRAFEWLDRAVAVNDPGLAEIPTQNLFESLYDDPRWLRFLQSIGRSPEQLAAIEFEVRLPE
jgi:class 3 adenylate cyclase/TolB-like protein/cytochrome c-type biogenesis protein CcmH/NrfG